MATIKDIARELNMGVSTVSMALNDNPRISANTKALVLSKAKDLGYIKNGIAVDLQKQKTNVILLVVTDASRSYFSSVISVIQDEVNRSGYDLLIVCTKGSTRTAKRYISEHRADGAIIYTNQIDEDFLRTYAREDFPIYVMGRRVEGEYIYSDSANGTETGSAASNYLLAKGHRKIAFMRGSLTTLGSTRRFQGYKRVMEENGIPFDESLVFDAHESTYEAGYEATKKIIDQIPKLDAIIYANDDIAIGGLKALLDSGIKVPEDISIIGSNDLPESKLITPALTTVRYEQVKDAYSSVELLVKAIRHEPIDKKKVAKDDLRKTELIIERETVRTKRKEG